MLLPLEKSDNNLLEEYLASRKLKPFDKTFYFKEPVVVNDKMFMGFGVISYNLNRISPKITKIDHRDKNGWSIVFSDKDSIPIYGIDYLNKDINKVIVTESALDAESFNQYTKLSDSVAIAFNRASFTLAQFHYLNYLSYYFGFEIFVAFDNDEAGKQATDRFVKKMQRDFNKKVGIISYPYKDFNDFLCKRENQFKMFVNNENILFK